MVHYHRSYNQLRKGDVGGGDEESGTQQLVIGFGRGGKLVNRGYYYFKRASSATSASPVRILLLCVLLFCSSIWGFKLLGCSSTLSLFYPFVNEVNESLCSSVSNGTICCDRSSIRTDICFMKGDVRTHSTSSSVVLYTTTNLQHEKIKPYTRKWEPNTMSTVNELDLVSKHKNLSLLHKCDVSHDVPAVFFSTGGYTGNLYHEFNDGIIPLYITSQHFKKKVVFVILEYHNWWFTKYGDILSELSDYPPINFYGEKKTHCFPEAIVGLKIHDELTVDSSLIHGKKTIRDFRDLLDRAYWPRIRGLIQDEEREAQQKVVSSPLSSSSSSKPVALLKSEMRARDTELKKPKLVILSRNGSRAISNEDLLVKLAEKIGFRAEVLKPERTTELSKIYRVLNSSDAMIGVHGAAMTHLLFVKPGNVFIQVIPLGTEWAAENYYGEPAKKLGLKYMGYKILPRESSLYNEYMKDDPVLTDPDSMAEKGWEFIKKTYLDNQNVNLNLRRFQKRLRQAYDYLIYERSLQVQAA